MIVALIMAYVAGCESASSQQRPNRHGEANLAVAAATAAATYSLIRSCYNVCYFQYITPDDSDLQEGRGGSGKCDDFALRRHVVISPGQPF